MSENNHPLNDVSVSIITHFHNSPNYGGVLQSYALRRIVTNLGYKAEQLRYLAGLPNPDTRPLPIRLTDKGISMFRDAKENGELPDFFKKCVRFSLTCTSYPFRIITRKLIISPRHKRRMKNFEMFNAQHIPSSPEYTNSTIHNAVDKYDIFITGSDQVWNPNWFCEPYYLKFVPDNKPKIAYAASTAVSFLTDEQYEKMQPLVSRMNHISVREKNAVDLLKDMTTQKIEWVLDPTLLLTADEWNEIAKKRHVEKPYIFVYLLGDKKENRRCIEMFAKEKGLPIVTCPFLGTNKLWQLWYGDIHSYGGPDEFVSLVRDAEYVLTDSFHGAVFSTIYQKKFAVLKRHADFEKEAMNERLYSLFQITEMGEQLVSHDDPDLASKIENVCYGGVEETINEWREKSIKWIKDALDVSVEQFEDTK